MIRPDYLSQGEEARLFPVLSTTSKEGRTASIVLSCLSKVSEFGTAMLGSIGTKTGKRATISSFTEVVFKNQNDKSKDRPDGLIILSNGKSEWRALVEAKIGGELLKEEQIERYRSLAKDHGIDCVITISNQFATTPSHHPLTSVSKSRSKIPVFHWSWMYMLTIADLLLSNDEIEDSDQQMLLFELCRFLTHDSAGVKGFDRMPKEWSELNRLVSAGGKIPSKSSDADAVMRAWYQETRDLSLILSRQTETSVSERLVKKHRSDADARIKSDLSDLRDTNSLTTAFDIPNTAAPVCVIADLSRRSIEVGMQVKAPEDRKSNKARVNWLLRQIKSSSHNDIFVRLNWPGRSEATQFLLTDLVENPAICEEGKDGLQVLSFYLFVAKRLGAKLTQQMNFISELEVLVPWFYREYGQNLAEWRKPPPKIENVKENISQIELDDLSNHMDKHD
ncbi:MAG: hypothetical protein WBG95_00845 [Sulfitobacter sp.]